jgi:ABC-type antimicrobial peptide transport system permease subunit
MLVEERKQEMGIARAVSMKRRHLTKLFLFEGIQYSLVALSVVVVVGLGIAYVILYVFGTILISFIPIIDIQIVLESFTFTPHCFCPFH